MFVRSVREAPSVVSTRVLRTHRKNSVENFRLQERVKTIDFEIKHNYSQISDEIDGVRQNLVKVKGVKKNVGVSVERRKLLRDKGLRILPSKQNGSEDYFTVRTSEGKDFIISCSDFYDGNTMRKKLSIDVRESTATPCLEVDNSDSEELIDSTSIESRSRRSTIGERPKKLRYRKITPPLRPGSRRNFRDADEENSEDEEKLLENISSMERKYGILRPQTAYLKRERQTIPRPRSRTCQANLQSDEAGRTPVRKVSRKNSTVAGNKRKKSRWNQSSVTSETNITEDSTEQLVQSKSKPQQDCNDNVVLEETFSLSSSARPKIRPRSITAPAVQVNSGITRTVVGIRRMSLETEKAIKLSPSPTGGKWFQPETPKSSLRGPRKSGATINEDNENMERKLSKVTERKVSWKDNVQDNNDGTIVNRSLRDGCSHSNGLLPDRNTRRGSLLNQSSYDGRAQSAPHSRPSMARNQNFPPRKVSKVNGRRSSQDFVYDARPDKALSKGYVTMQMTIGNKQVKVYVPKFTSECVDEVVERARAKSAVKAAGAASRPMASSKR